MAAKGTWMMALIGAAVLLIAATPEKGTSANSAARTRASAEMIKRGEYLVTVGGCNDCHTPMKMTPIGLMPDMDRMLSGFPDGDPEPQGKLGAQDILLAGTDLTVFKQPFGTVYARNLTPDKTGLGEWTEKQFIETMRTGRHQGDGRALLPPMPWPNFSRMSEEDLRAVFAFLQSIKPIKNIVPDPKVPPPVLDQFLKNNAAISRQMRAGPDQ